MGLQSTSLKGDAKLEACLISDPAHITQGAAGPHVGKIQRALIKLDSARIDAGELAASRYGPSTAAAVLSFKTRRNIVNPAYQTRPDNIVGRMTIAALDAELLKTEPPGPSQHRELRAGDSGADVKTLQCLLNHHLAYPRTPLNADGVFGPQTETRVKEFQALNRLYPMTLGKWAGAPREALAPTGVVDQATLVPLLDMRVVRSYDSTFRLVSDAPSSAAPERASAPPIRTISNAAVGDPQPPTPTRKTIVVSSGEQATVNPWNFSAFVFTGQYTVLAKNDGRPDFSLTGGGQVAVNSSRASGKWSAQGFIQMGLGGFPFAKFGNLDLLNPLVQFMITHNHAPNQNTFGGAIGNQINYTLVKVGSGKDAKDVLNLFFNSQVVTNIDLSTGFVGAPSGQFMIGGLYNFDLIF